MASPNRAALIKKILRVARKHYKPVTSLKDRSVLEHLLFACLLENSPHDAAERGFSALEKDYFGWNEVRVSTVNELAEELRGLTDPEDSARRLKRTLHSVFETVYAFDIENLRKQNIGQSVKQLERHNGTTPFVVAYVTQAALGGHAIPVNKGLMITFEVLGVVSEAEARKGAVPGLERAIPKSKGVEVASVLHQLGVEVGRNPYGQATRKLLLEIDPECKDRLPKRPPKAAPAEETPASQSNGQSGQTSGKKKSAGKKSKESTEEKKPSGKKSSKPAKKTPAKKTPAAKKSAAKKKSAKKGAKGKTKTASRRLSKRKPR